MEHTSNLFKALSDTTRLRILSILYYKKLCVCDIHNILQISQTKCSRHLIYLKNYNLVQDTKIGKWSHYSLTPTSNEALEFIIKNYLSNTKEYKIDINTLNNHKINTCGD